MIVAGSYCYTVSDPNPRPGIRPFRPAIIGSLIMIVATSALSYWASKQIAPDARIPIHWNGEGEVDGYAGPMALWHGVFVIIGLVAVLAVVPWIDPRRNNLLHSSCAYQTVWLTIVAFMSAVHAGIVFTALDYAVPMNRVVGVGVGLLFAIIGVCMANIRSNFVFGIRTQWTLSSEVSWRKTHRLGARLFVLMGAVLVICAFIGADSGIFFVVGIISIVALLITLTTYSYLVWKKDPERNPPFKLFRRSKTKSKSLAPESEKEG